MAPASRGGARTVLVVGGLAALVAYAATGSALLLVLAGGGVLVAAGSRSFLSWSLGDWADFVFTRALPWVLHRLWLYRAGLLPLYVGGALVVAGAGISALAVLGAPAPACPPELAAACPAPSPGWVWAAGPGLAGLAGALVLALAGGRLADPAQRAWLSLVPDALDDGRKGVLDRLPERLYLAALLLAGGGWLAARVWWGFTDGVRWALAFLLLAYGVPWWWHRGFRRRRPLSKWARRWRRVEGNELLKAWHGSRVVAVEGNRRAATLVVRLRGGRTVKQVGGDSLSLSSVLGLRPGAITVGVDRAAAARVRVRVVPRDPWRGVLPHPLLPVGSLDLAERPRPMIGEYEDASDTHVRLQQHMIVVGQTGSGKSVWLESLLAWILSYRHAAVVAADLASGATLGVWAEVFSAPLATDVHSAMRLLAGVFREIERREAELAARKAAGELIDTLPVDEHNPALFVIVDEFPDLVKAARAAKIDLIPVLERTANKARKVEVWLQFYAQNPTTNDVGSTELRGAMTATVGLGLSERQSQTLWGSARELGWDSTPLRRGTFLLADRDDDHQEPRPAKGLWIPPAARLTRIREASRALAPLPAATRAALDAGAADPLPGLATPAVDTRKRTPRPPTPPVTPRQLDPLPADPRDDDPVPPRGDPPPPPPPEPELPELVLAELPDAGGPTVAVVTIAAQLAVSRDQVNRALRRLAATGRARQAGRGRWERCP